MDMKTKQHVLYQIYGIYDEFAQSMEVACKPGCSACCTLNVTATTNEAYRVFNYLKSMEDIGLTPKLETHAGTNRFRPVVTTNRMANLCMTDTELPVEENPTDRERCLFLENDLCSIYPHRPFGCRCFVSRQDCALSGCADIDPFVLSVNTVFLQFIEHIDTPGLTGNFIDTLIYLDSPKHLKDYEHNTLKQANTPLIQNQSIPTLLIPPEHRDHIQPILSRLQGIKIPG